MAARRLVIVMLVLLAVSTLAAALVPTPESDDPRPVATDTATSGQGPEPDAGAAGSPEGRLVARRIRVGEGEKPRSVEVRSGDQLLLLVSGRLADDIAIPAFGLVETMTPFSPARFDLIVDRTGRFPIRAERAARVVGRIVSVAGSGRCASLRPPARGGRSRAEACAPGGRRSARDHGRSAPRPSAAEDRRRR